MNLNIGDAVTVNDKSLEKNNNLKIKIINNSLKRFSNKKIENTTVNKSLPPIIDKYNKEYFIKVTQYNTSVSVDLLKKGDDYSVGSIWGFKKNLLNIDNGGFEETYSKLLKQIYKNMDYIHLGAAQFIEEIKNNKESLFKKYGYFYSENVISASFFINTNFGKIKEQNNLEKENFDVEFVYPGDNRTELVEHYYGVSNEELKKLQEGNYILSGDKKFLVIDVEMKNKRACVIEEKNIKFGKTIRDKCVYLADEDDIYCSFDALFPCNRVGLRKKTFKKIIFDLNKSTEKKSTIVINNDMNMNI
jgi:hypothetical protein